VCTIPAWVCLSQLPGQWDHVWNSRPKCSPYSTAGGLYPILSPGWDLGAPAPEVQVYFLELLSKCEGWNLDFIRTLAGFYPDPIREIISAGFDPPQVPDSGHSIPKRTQAGSDSSDVNESMPLLKKESLEARSWSSRFLGRTKMGRNMRKTAGPKTG
jgi:hypothetical protein